MTKEHSKDKVSQHSTTESAKERLLRKSRKIPHPGGVRVTIFENPRVQRPQIRNVHRTLQNPTEKGE